MNWHGFDPSNHWQDERIYSKMTNDEKTGIDKYTETHSIFQRCKGCKGRSFIKAQGLFEDKIQNIWVCTNCGLPKARRD